MKRFALFLGILGVMAGIALMLNAKLSPRPQATISQLPPDALMYNVGTAHELPGTDSMLYENAALGIRFGYPKSYGTVVVEKHDGGIFFSFTKTGDPNDPARAYFMAAQYQEPQGHAAYWGDLSWYANPDPAWNTTDAPCNKLSAAAKTMPINAKALVESSTCTNLPLEKKAIARLERKSSLTYLFPAFTTAANGEALDMFAVSDDRLLTKAEFEQVATNVEKIVKSLEILQTTR